MFDVSLKKKEDDRNGNEDEMRRCFRNLLLLKNIQDGKLIPFVLWTASLAQVFCPVSQFVWIKNRICVFCQKTLVDAFCNLKFILLKYDQILHWNIELYLQIYLVKVHLLFITVYNGV